MGKWFISTARQDTKSHIVAMSGDPQSLDQLERLAQDLDLNLIGVLEKPFASVTLNTFWTVWNIKLFGVGSVDPSVQT